MLKISLVGQTKIIAQRTDIVTSQNYVAARGKTSGGRRAITASFKIAIMSSNTMGVTVWQHFTEDRNAQWRL
jgi:hypothetical protein